VILVNIHAEGLQIPRAEWMRLLQLALSRDWRPQGTRAPAMSIDGGRELWDGRYDLAAGQEVTREDALSLAIALQSVTLDDGQAKELVSFCKRSGFSLRTRTRPASHKTSKTSRALWRRTR